MSTATLKDWMNGITGGENIDLETMNTPVLVFRTSRGEVGQIDHMTRSIIGGLYELFALIILSGVSEPVAPDDDDQADAHYKYRAQGTHYTSYIKKPDSKWYYYDDSGGIRARGRGIAAGRGSMTENNPPSDRMMSGRVENYVPALYFYHRTQPADAGNSQRGITHARSFEPETVPVPARQPRSAPGQQRSLSSLGKQPSLKRKTRSRTTKDNKAKKTQVTCSVCGEKGHTKRSKSCPEY
jgi:hypothetical protein